MLRIVAHSKAPEYSFICQVLPSEKLRRHCPLLDKTVWMIKQSAFWALESSWNCQLLREQIQQLNTQNLRG
jgi:hypothetical protein